MTAPDILNLIKTGLSNTAHPHPNSVIMADLPPATRGEPVRYETAGNEVGVTGETIAVGSIVYPESAVIKKLFQNPGIGYR